MQNANFRKNNEFYYFFLKVPNSREIPIWQHVACFERSENRSNPFFLMRKRFSPKLKPCCFRVRVHRTDNNKSAFSQISTFQWLENWQNAKGGISMLWREAPENFGYFRCSRCSKTTKVGILWFVRNLKSWQLFSR